MKAYFVSDLHLNSADESKLARFRDFLDRLQRESVTHLFLVGDIFDLWVGDHAYFQRAFASVVEPIQKLVKSGIEVHYFEGNHDLHLRGFWEDQVGALVHVEAEVFELGGRRVRVEHGDQMNPDDRGYLFLRWLLRTPAVKSLALHLPAAAVSAIGERASRASREYTSTAKELPKDRIRAMIRTHAEKVFRERPYDLLISGHVHLRDDQEFEVGGLRARSVNLGSWFETPAAFLLTDSEARFVEV